MPIITPHVNTAISMPHPGASRNPVKDMLLQNFLQQFQPGKGILQGMESKDSLDKLIKGSELKKDEYKSELQTDADMQKSLRTSGDVPEDASLGVGKIHVGVDPASKNLQTLTKSTGAENTKLGGEYGKIKKSHEASLTGLESGISGLRQGDALGLKQAAIAAARQSEGQGQRLLQSVIHEFGGDPSIIGSADKLSNFIDGLQRSGKSDALKQSLGKLLESGYKRQQEAYNADMAGFKQRAPGMAPFSAQQPNFSQSLDSYGSELTPRYKKLGEDFASFRTPAQPAPASANDVGPIPAVGGAIKNAAGSALSGLASLFRPASPASNQAPQAPKRVISPQDLQAYSSKHGITPEESASFLKGQGYQIGQ